MRLLAADPDLGADLAPETAGDATRALCARVARLPQGSWEPRLRRNIPGALGLMILDGVIARTNTIGGIASSELLGAGDLLRPWQGDDLPLPSRIEWQVLEPAQVAVLDAAFTARAAHWPEVLAAVTGRAMRRCRWRGLATCIAQMNRVDTRLLVLMSHFGERWGRVTADGTVIPLRLTHQRLSELVAAQRPTVSSALSRLSASGLLLRCSDRSWLLTPAGRHSVAEMLRTADPHVRAAVAA